MFLFMTLSLIVIILLVFLVLTISVFGAGAIIIFGDVIICIFIFGWIFKRIFFKKNKRS